MSTAMLAPERSSTADAVSLDSLISAPGPVLVATDGRDVAATAVLVAGHVATRLGASPEVLAVLEPFPVYADVPVFVPPGVEAGRMAAVRESVERQVERQASAAWPTDVVVGPVGRTIADVATERHASVVVLGIGQHRLVDRVFGTESALQVLRHGDRPVLAVGPNADGVFRQAVVAVDFAPASTRAAAIACRLLEPGGTLTLVHVRTRLELSQPAWDAWDAHSGAHVRDLLGRLVGDLRLGTTGCDEWGPDGERTDITIGSESLVGDPTRELLDYAVNVRADLVAAGTRGAGFVARLFIGSVATDLVRLTSARLPSCSVLACGAPNARAAERMARRMSDTSEALDPVAWRQALESFGRRNADRRTVVETDGPSLGAQVLARGYTLLGATYDPHDERAELMLGSPDDRQRHLTHTIGDVVSVGVRTGSDGRDVALRIEQPDGQTLVTFVPAD